MVKYKHCTRHELDFYNYWDLLESLKLSAEDDRLRIIVVYSDVRIGFK